MVTFSDSLPRRLRRWSPSIATVLASAVLASGLATVAGLPPWIFLMAFGCAGTYILVPALGWGLAAWSTAAMALFVSTWIMVVNPFLGVRLDVSVVSLLIASVLAGLVVGYRRYGRELLLPKASVMSGLVVVAPAAISALAIGVSSLVRGSSLTWAMRGDAQFNTVLSRHIAEGNGETFNNVQVLSLAQGLMAMVHLPGRDAVPMDELLTHDIGAQVNLWLLMILLSSILAGAIAERVLRDSPRSTRYIGTVASAMVPLTWHMTGYAMDSGFYNVSLAFLALELAFYFWLKTSAHPLWGSSALLGLTVVMLGAWTPMALVPLVLAAWSGWVGLSKRPSLFARAIWFGAVAQLVGFGAAFILPGFLAKSSVLSADGTIIPFNINLYVAISAAAVLVALASGFGPMQPTSIRQRYGLGTLLLCLSAAAGTGFLVVQNRALPNPWTYYPIKFAWVSTEMIILLLLIGASLLVGQIRKRRVLSVAAATASAVFLVSVLQMNPPRETYGSAYFPLLDLARNDRPLDETLPLLTSVSGEKLFFSRYLSGDEDFFMNQWQFQITAEDEYTPIRGFAYRVVTSIADVCSAARAWGGGVEVITADPEWANTLNSRCGTPLTAVVRDPTN